jgi:hypothetical protein
MKMEKYTIRLYGMWTRMSDGGKMIEWICGFGKMKDLFRSDKHHREHHLEHHREHHRLETMARMD